MKKKTFRKLEALLHFLTALVLLLKGVDLIARKLYFPGVILLGLAMVILVISIFWRKIGIKPKQGRIICYYLESPALLITAYVLYLENKENFPHIFLIAALIYPMMGFISSRKFKRIKKRSFNQ
jgi:hypothetical protein